MKEAISPKDFAEAIGVSESSVKRWVDQGLLNASRTAGGHRRIARDEALRWLRDHPTPIVRPDRLGLPEATGLVEPTTPLEAIAADLRDDLLQGREVEARGRVAGAWIAGHAVALIADELIRPVLAHIGTLWEHNDAGIYVEHRATQICLGALQALHGLALGEPAVQTVPDACPALKPVAVGGAPSGDPYLIAPLLAATVLGEAGFHAINLGPETPLPVLGLAAEQLDASLVFVSMGSLPIERTLRDLQQLADRLTANRIQLAIGGRFVDAGLAQRVPSAFIGRSFGELAAFARGLAQGPGMAGAANERPVTP